MDENKLTEIEKETLKVAQAYASNPTATPKDIILLYSSMVREILARRKADGPA